MSAVSREPLMSLRNEARTLADGTFLTPAEVEDWRQRTASALQKIYGSNSEPVRDFSRVRFDDRQIVDVAERVLQERAAEEGVDVSGLKIGLPAVEEVLRRGLYEAIDLLSSLIV